MPKGVPYSPFMSPILLIVLLLAMAAVVATLFIGLFSMAKGGAFNARYGNLLMRWRVVLQAVAVLVLIVAAIAAAN